MKQGKKKSRQTTSKRVVALSISQFIVVMFYSLICTYLEIDISSILCYLLPSSAAICTAAIGFYFNKSKMENLSKQRIRYVYLKLLLQDKLDPEVYQEIEDELSHIDDLINDKLSGELSDAINADVRADNI